MSDEKKLREILKRGDPAAGDPGLSMEEVREMRRAVLSAVPEPRRLGWLVPVLAGAAALVLAALLVLTLWQPESEVVKGGRPPLPLAGEGRGEGSVVVEKTPPHRPSAGRPAQEREPPPSPKKKPVRRDPDPEPIFIAQVEAPSTQIQFSTPGGTRVIWVLHPATE